MQAVFVEAPVVGKYLPLLHSLQAIAPVSSVHHPVGHIKHPALVMEIGRNLPLPHTIQDACPVAGCVKPLGQLVQTTSAASF
tara:strand:- start:790 stop:1035 length:246 start_codon:yes stop_codon:yes gene_type:complete